MIDNDGRQFRSIARPDIDAPVALYRQDGDSLWAEFARPWRCRCR